MGTEVRHRDAVIHANADAQVAAKTLQAWASDLQAGRQVWIPAESLLRIANMLEQNKLQKFEDVAVAAFSRAMLEQLRADTARPDFAWAFATSGELKARLLAKVAEGDPVAVANFCVMLWNRGASTK